MNPSPIGTPIERIIDEWFFNVSDTDGQKCIHFDIKMTRPRDIEAEKFKFLFTAHVVTDPKRARRYKYRTDLKVPLLHGLSLMELREVCQSYVAALEGENWNKVIVVAAKKQTEQWAVTRPVSYDFGVGYQSKDGKWFRESLTKPYLDRNASYLLSDHSVAGVVHPWSQELEDHLKGIRQRFLKLGDAMEELIKSPERILNSGPKLLLE